MASVAAVIWAADTDAPCRPMGAQGGQKGEGGVSEADSICNEGSDELGSDRDTAHRVRVGTEERATEREREGGAHVNEEPR